MEKIPSLLVAHRKTTPFTINPACAWVMEGKGFATRQFDGRCYAVLDNRPYAHHQWGWTPVPTDDALFWQVWQDGYDSRHVDWSYELVGPMVNGNPERATNHALIPHGTYLIRPLDTPTISTIRAYLATHDVEGIVWWEDPWNLGCRKAKVQQADFNMRRIHRER